jgi:hypothetical protein
VDADVGSAHPHLWGLLWGFFDRQTEGSFAARSWLDCVREYLRWRRLWRR